MRLKRLLTIVLAIIPMIVFAQTADKQAASLFSQGKYDDAAKLYDIAASTTLNDQATRQRFYELAEKSRKCSEYRKNGNFFYGKKEYSKAKNSLKDLLRLNPKDKRAENLIDSCDYYLRLSLLEQEKKEAQQKQILAQNDAKRKAAEKERLELAEQERKEKELQEQEKVLKEARLYYSYGNYDMACSAFERIGVEKLTLEDLELYQKSEEEATFNLIVKNELDVTNKEMTYKQFLSKYPNSRHYNTVSNTLSEYYVAKNDYQNAEKYASDEWTKAFVSNSKKQYEESVKRANSSGFEKPEQQKWLRLGGGISYESLDENNAYWGLQALLTIGSYRNYFNLDLGIDYSGSLFSTLGGIKWNVFRLDESSFYLGYQFNLFFIDDPDLYNIRFGNKSYYSEKRITAGLQGKHYDLGIFSCYAYKSFGAKFIYYF